MTEETVYAWGRTCIDGEWTPLEQLSPVTHAGPVTLKTRGFCAVTMPDGFETSAEAETDEAAARIVLQQLRQHYGREFRLTWDEKGIDIRSDGADH